MRKLALIIVTLAALVIGSPAVAGTDDLIVGLNGVATSGFDIVAGAIEGDQKIDLGPLNPVSDRLTGVVTGAIEAGIRLGTGALDAATFTVTEKVGGPYSPEARIDLFKPIIQLLVDAGLIDSAEAIGLGS